MALRSDTAELLQGFEKRMKFINIVRFFLDYPYPDKIRSMIPDHDILDNVIVAVLVFIKDKTLASEQVCTLEDITEFLEDFSAVFPEEYAVDCKELARYIIVDVLQHGGQLMEYTTYYSSEETFRKMPIRLLNEEKGNYHLTDDAFDFLFRSKEIESELDYSVTRFRMKEYMRRNNYTEALNASRELVNKIRSMKLSMADFLLRCRENISNITTDQYEGIIERTRNLLEDEYEELKQIQDNAKERAAVLQEAQETGLGDAETIKNRKALHQIIDNINITLNEQRSLINRKTALSDEYGQLLLDSFATSRFERMNFEKDILAPLRKLEDSLGDAANFLLYPLVKPAFAKQFSVENFYAEMGKINEEEDDTGLEIDEDAEETENLSAIRNQRYVRIIETFFRFASEKENFRISEYISALSLNEILDFTEENALMNALLAMFALQVLDIEAWKNSKHVDTEPDGEFEIGWCLGEIDVKYISMKQLSFHNSEQKYPFEVRMGDVSRRITLTDYMVEVKR